MLYVIAFIALFILWDWIGDLFMLLLGLGMYPLVIIVAGIGLLCLVAGS